MKIITVDSFGNTIKEDIIEIDDDKETLIMIQNSFEKQICNDDEIKIIFKTDIAPEEHISFHNFLVNKIQESKQYIFLQHTITISKQSLEIEFKWKKLNE